MIAFSTPEAAEVAVLHSILSDPYSVTEVSGVLTANDFGTLDHREIYSSIQSVHRRGSRPDFITVRDDLASKGHERLSVDIFTMNPDVYTSSVYIADYAASVIRHSRRRSIVQEATNLISRVHQDTDSDPVELAHQALSSISNMSDGEDGPIMYADVMDDFRQRITLQAAGEWREKMFATGLIDLDRQMGGGARPGELIYLAGRPGSGKSALALQIMHNSARRSEPVLMFSGEMSAASLIERGMSEVSGLPIRDIRNQQISEAQYDALMDATERMQGLPVGIDATPGITTAQMLIRAQRFQRRHGLGAIFFDYIELSGDKGKEGETQRLGEVSRALKRMAMTLDVPVFALSQLNRNVESRNPPVPRMSDLRQSGSLEQDADMVMMIYRHDYYHGQGIVEFDASKQGVADIIIGKHRNGATGTVSVGFRDSTMSFYDLAKGDRW